MPARFRIFCLIDYARRPRAEHQAVDLPGRRLDLCNRQDPLIGMGTSGRLYHYYLHWHIVTLRVLTMCSRTVRDICKNSLFLSSVLCLLLAPNCRALSLSYSFESLPKVFAFSLTWVTQRANLPSLSPMLLPGSANKGPFGFAASIKGVVG
ncbi:hypothetical protein EDB83DRAFT_1257470 [Lactarius deliciosus]|nr:hypothetical protein EDB83DRAFT_1257470 [Lactarius deliciosus]